MNTWSLLIDMQMLQDLTDQRRERLAAQWGRRWRIAGRRSDRGEQDRAADRGLYPDHPAGHDLAA